MSINKSSVNRNDSDRFEAHAPAGNVAKPKKGKETKEERERRERRERIEKRRQERAARKTMEFSTQTVAPSAEDHEKEMLQEERMGNLFREALFTAGDMENGKNEADEVGIPRSADTRG